MVLPFLAVGAFFALWWFTRQSELFCVTVRRGHEPVVRGRIPGGMLAEIKRATVRVRYAKVKAFKSERGGRLVFSGDIDEGVQQRLRNTFALYPAAQLRHAPLIGKPTLGEALGVAWIASLFDRWRG
jgi:hypothetical protein